MEEKHTKACSSLQNLLERASNKMAPDILTLLTLTQSSFVQEGRVASARDPARWNIPAKKVLCFGFRVIQTSLNNLPHRYLKEKTVSEV